MKKTDIAMIILIASVSMLAAYGAMTAIPALKPSTDAAKVKTIEKYTDEVIEPDEKVFNDKAINPTVDVTIGE